jgi:hypothetical protein
MAKRIFLIAILLAAFCLGSFAATSESYVISLEVFGGGGGDATSTNHELHGKARGMGYGIHSSSSFRMGDGFIYGSYSLPLGITITSVSPVGAINVSAASVSIFGSNFMTGVAVWLTKAGQLPISGESVTLINSGRIDCTFNITGKHTGIWNVEVENPGGETAVLQRGFTVGSTAKPVELIGKPTAYPSPMNPAQGPATIKYTLTEDAPVDLYLYNISGTRIWEEHYPPGAAGGATGANQVLWDGYNAFSGEVPNGIYVYQISSGGRTLATGKIAVFK